MPVASRQWPIMSKRPTKWPLFVVIKNKVESFNQLSRPKANINKDERGRGQHSSMFANICLSDQEKKKTKICALVPSSSAAFRGLRGGSNEQMYLPSHWKFLGIFFTPICSSLSWMIWFVYLGYVAIKQNKKEER